MVGLPTAIFHFDGTTWSAPYPVTLPPRRDSMPWVPRNINTVYGNPAGEVFIVDSGGGGNILRFSGGGWVVELAEGPNLYSLWAPSPETVWALGDHYLYRRSGTSWAIDPGFNGVASAGAMSAAPIVSTPSPSAVITPASPASSVTGTASAGAPHRTSGAIAAAYGTAQRETARWPAHRGSSQ